MRKARSGEGKDRLRALAAAAARAAGANLTTYVAEDDRMPLKTGVRLPPLCKTVALAK